MTPAARQAVEREFLAIMRSRRPDLIWTVCRERADAGGAAASGEIRGGLTGPKEPEAAGDGGTLAR